MKLHRRQVRNEVFALAIVKSGGSRREILQNSHGKRAQRYSLRRSAGLDRVSVINTRSPIGEQPEVAIHGILVQRDQQVEAVTHVGDFFQAGANGKKKCGRPE